ncbi:MAS20-domain-containing protein [Coemansia reversa NRRL 1564]|uniref:Histone-lysine N-methyltransferase SET5 n=1 Tax=Coemansia reversa (strain ATCC 12441 / NRRL 1564) TaxID=763665 RepID=A0A2G5BHW6_COERN|nr:MAS20-domain-containing protein [Coemansia reversa NRRL 1564]|eukprot:PIA18610.1 MAS20-domain-containing protein [Coemansia reversa NRRL 1564]
MVTGKQIAVTASVTALVAGISYVAYFDYNRRNNPQFRRKLRRERKKAEKKAEKISKESLSDDVGDLALELLKTLSDEKLPESQSEKEKYFMKNLSKGEALCQASPDSYPAAACCFYQALRVYPNPVELVMIYQKSTPEMVFRLVMSMMAQEARQKQARYFDVFPPKDKHVQIKDKNKSKDKKSAEEDDNKSEVVVPNRALFATKDFAPGDIVYEEDALVSTLLPCAQNGQFCYHCMKLIPQKEAEEEEAKPGEDEEKCDKCHETVYCSEKCRQDAYDGYHQFLCPNSNSSAAREFALLAQQSHELSPILIAKFFGILLDREKKKELERMLGGANVKQSSDIDEYTTWEHLECMRYLELIPTSNDSKMLKKLGELLNSNVPGLTEFVTNDRYTMLKGKLDYNAYAVHSADGVEVPLETEETRVSDTMRDDHASSAVGISLYLISAHIAHDCDPNAQIIFPENTSKAAIKVLKPIAADEELRVSFVDPSLDVEVRRKKLQTAYRLECSCSKCKSDLAAKESAPTATNTATSDVTTDSTEDTATYAEVAASTVPSTTAASNNDSAEAKTQNDTASSEENTNVAEANVFDADVPAPADLPVNSE